jgi:molecular chaperone HscA
MALLQISEPDASPTPHQRKLAVGIDLGTTHSLVATVRHSVPEVLPDAQGHYLLPSVVRYLSAQETQVGYDALAVQDQYPLDTLVSVKRLMGKSLADAQETRIPYTLDQVGQSVSIVTEHATVTPVEVSAQILRTLRVRAEATLGDTLVGAVITVPAYFDDAQRQATRDAARLAGLNVLRLLNEPTAAAIAYGLDQAQEGLFAVYDLGGGTFDFSVLKLSKGLFEVVSTGGDTALGGDDFDALIAQHFLNQSPENPLSEENYRHLLSATKRLRENLTEIEHATLKTDLPGKFATLSLSRTEFDLMAQPLVKRTLDCALHALDDASLEPIAIQDVVLVGGATRMPLIQSAVAQFFESTPRCTINPDEVVAIGAALQANLLAGNRAPGEDWLLLDVTPLSLGIETMGGLVENIIARNSTIPVARAQEFTTYKDGQTAIALHVLQGERDLAQDCRSLAKFELRGITPMVAGAARLKVTFQVDADGLLSVSAREEVSGVEASVTVKPSHGLTDDNITKMLTESMSEAQHDSTMRMLREQQVDSTALIESVLAALSKDSDLLSTTEQALIDHHITLTQTALKSDNVDNLKEETVQLSQVTDAFAARRMDRSIRAALTGKTLDQL